MATISIDETGVHVHLSWFERIAGILRDQHLRFEDIQSVSTIEDPRRSISGLRAPGLSVPGGSRIGTWRTDRQRIFVCVHGPGPAVRIECSNGRYRTFLVSVDDPASIAARIG